MKEGMDWEWTEIFFHNMTSEIKVEGMTEARGLCEMMPSTVFCMCVIITLHACTSFEYQQDVYLVYGLGWGWTASI